MTMDPERLTSVGSTFTFDVHANPGEVLSAADFDGQIGRVQWVTWAGPPEGCTARLVAAVVAADGRSARVTWEAV